MMIKGFMRTLTLAFAGLLTQTTVFAADLVVAGVTTTTADSATKAKLVDLWQPGDSGQRMNIRGRVTGADGAPLAGIEIAIRQPDGDGDWTEQYRHVWEARFDRLDDYVRDLRETTQEE